MHIVCYLLRSLNIQKGKNSFISIAGWRSCWLLRDHCSKRSLVSSATRLNTKSLIHFFHSSPLMNVFNLGSSKEDVNDENIIQKEAEKIRSVCNLLCTLCLIINFTEIFQNSDLCWKRDHSSWWWFWWTCSCPLIRAQTCSVCLIGGCHVVPAHIPSGFY